MKLYITKCTYTDKKKDGTQIQNKWGKVAYRVGLRTNEYGTRWINGFLPFVPNRWEGSEQELDITEEEYNGQKQLRFALPNKDKQRDEKIAAIETTIFNLEKRIFAIEHNADNAKQDVPAMYKTDENEPSKEELKNLFGGQ